MKATGITGISKQVSERMGLSWNDVDAVIRDALVVMAKEISNGQPLMFRGFGTFEFRLYQRRIVRNPKNPEDQFELPARHVVVFKPVEKLKSSVRRLRKEDIGKEQSPQTVNTP